MAPWQVLSPELQHLADVQLRFVGEDGGQDVGEALCSRLELSKASNVLAEAFAEELTLKRSADGLFSLQLTTHFTGAALEDALRFIHQQAVPDELGRVLAMFGPLDCWQVDVPKSTMKSALDRLGQLPAEEALDGLSHVPPAVLQQLPSELVGRVCMKSPVSLDWLLRCWEVLGCTDKGKDRVDRELLSVSPPAALEWLAAAAPADSPARLSSRLGLLRLRVPSALLAIKLGSAGLLTAQAYGDLAPGLTLPDFAALASFTPLVRQRHSLQLRTALEQHSVCAQFKIGTTTSLSFLLTTKGWKPKHPKIEHPLASVSVNPDSREVRIKPSGSHFSVMRAYAITEHGALATAEIASRAAGTCTLELPAAGGAPAAAALGDPLPAGRLYVLLVQNYL